MSLTVKEGELAKRYRAKKSMGKRERLAPWSDGYKPKGRGPFGGRGRKVPWADPVPSGLRGGGR